MKMRSKSTMPKEFVAKNASKPGAVKRAERFDAKQDKAVAKKFGVKYKG